MQALEVCSHLEQLLGLVPGWLAPAFGAGTGIGSGSNRRIFLHVSPKSRIVGALVTEGLTPPGQVQDKGEPGSAAAAAADHSRTQGGGNQRLPAIEDRNEGSTPTSSLHSGDEAQHQPGSPARLQGAAARPPVSLPSGQDEVSSLGARGRVFEANLTAACRLEDRVVQATGIDVVATSSSMLHQHAHVTRASDHAAPQLQPPAQRARATSDSRALVGVRALWVSRDSRRGGLATRMLDVARCVGQQPEGPRRTQPRVARLSNQTVPTTAPPLTRKHVSSCRCHCVHGYVVPREKIAFAQVEEVAEGKAFAQAYSRGMLLHY